MKLLKEVVKIGKFSNAIGQWEVNEGGISFELVPTMGDVKRLRNIVLNDKIRKDKPLMMDKFADFMHGLIVEKYPEEDKQEIREWVEVNCMNLMTSAMVAFKFTSEEDLEKSKRSAEEEIKKATSSI